MSLVKPGRVGVQLREDDPEEEPASMSNPSSHSQAVLEGIKVIDLTQALAGPYCSMMLGDLGADVLKVEPPGSGDQSRGWGPPFLEGESAYFLSVNRNKRSLTLNLKHPEAQSILHRLVREADVFLANQPRISSLKSLKIDWETLHALNPRLVYGSITGYGMTGPYAGRGGYDVIAQAESGLMALTGEPEHGPIRYPIPLADVTAGIYSTIGVLGALLVRERTGEGQFVDTTLMESQVAWLTNVGGAYFATGQRPPKLGNVHPNIVPYQPFRARDKHLIVAVGTERLWARFCEVLGIAETIGRDPRFFTNRDRLMHRAELIPLLEAIFAQDVADHWVEKLLAAEIPSGPINYVDQTLNDPHLRARGFIVELEHPLIGTVKSPGDPVNLSKTPVTYRLPPPLLGQHTNEVLSALGYGLADLERLRDAGVV